MPTRAERIAGGLVGLLVGDALGVPYEFSHSLEIPPREAIEFQPPPGFKRAHRRVPPGTWSDDGAQALCLLASLLHRRRLDLADLGKRLLNWHEWGYLAVDGLVFDVGVQTSQALLNLRAGAEPLEAGLSHDRANGNGSLMRSLPLALWHQGTDEELVRDTCLQSRITHAHSRSQACCALYVLWGRRTLEESSAPWDEAVRTLRALWPESLELRRELEAHIRPDDQTPGEGSGYVVDCLRSARDVVAGESTYAGIVKAAIALGDDTDTTACVAGGIAGVREGIEAIPQRWREGLRGQQQYQPLLEALLQAPGSSS